MRKILAFLLLSSTAFAAAYTAESEFSVANGNPNGVWAYGYRVGTNPAFTNFTNTEVDFAGIPGFDRWHTGLSNSGDPLYYLGVYLHPSGQLLLHPSNSTERSVVRFIAPNAGTWVVNATFSDGDNATTSVDIQRDGDAGFLFSDFVTNDSSTSYKGSVSLAAGQSLDFIVGNNGNHNNDSTLLSLTISEVPEPETFLLLGGALVTVSAFHRRRLG
ncbi:MAG TPA: PEP-CTERM sorting domain-containing protein [Bryobacteraceae bacterium]|nr:PEP-CTERM sorting domain-containing protein [Bryobacteraceae bacterium]